MMLLGYNQLRIQVSTTDIICLRAAFQSPQMILLHAASDTALALERKASDWKYITIRHQGAKKKLQAWFPKKEIYIVNPITDTKHSLTLIIRQDKECTIKYSFCHCPEATLKDLAYRQSKRYFV